MATFEIIGYVLFLGMGITLGLVGAGGSILTIPILVYVFGITPLKATTYSLFVVGTSSLVGALRYRHLLREVRALYFAIPSICAVFFTRWLLLARVPEYIFGIARDRMMMIIFAFIMLCAGILMTRPLPKTELANSRSIVTVTIIALIFGVIMGFMGLGGGFLIVPVLVFLLRIDMKRAVATSLAIITLNAAVGFLADQSHLEWIDYERVFGFALLAVVGLSIGVSFNHKLNSERLKRIFGYFVISVSLMISIREALT